VPSGYGKQARYAGQILRDLGHQVAFSCFSGLGGQPIRWDGYTLFPSGALSFGIDTVVPHALSYGADLIIPIMDFFKLEPAAGQLHQVAEDPGIGTAAFLIADCMAENGGPSVPDQRTLAKTGAYPVAVSRFGVELLTALGYDAECCSYVPHCVDTEVYRPPDDRQALRDELGTPGDFIVGIMAANRDLVRKGFPEQMAAFARFSRRHKDARLALFTVADGPGGVNLMEMASDMGIADKTVFMPGYEQVAGMLPEEFMAKWYGSLDILSLCSYAEGFGVPLIEAQACGTPVVATHFSAMAELAVEAGWLVEGHRFWNPQHRAWWLRPDEDSILRAWERAYQEGSSEGRSGRARDFALEYNIPLVRDNYWAPFMKRMAEAL
jgi:glycosyltransferase involved in cell wall biosynthesis